MPSIACIVLAAGSSSRFGTDKMLHQLPNGNSVIETTVDQYLKVFEHITVVVTSVATHPLRDNPRINLVNVEGSTEGMSASLKLGVNGNLKSDGWLIALGDMPYIQAASIEILRDTLTQNNIVLPSLQGRQGNPVGFGCVFKNQLMSVRGDKGAKSLIRKNLSSVHAVPMLDKGIVHDIDRLQDIL